MSDLYIFEYGDPKNMMLPDQFLLCFEGCMEYPNRILKNRTREEIVNTMRDLDIEVNRQAPFEQEYLYFINKRPDLQLDFLGTSTGRQGIITLMRMFNEGDIPALNHIENPTWSEIYAIYTLGLIAYANRDLDIYENSNELNKEEYLFELAGEYLAEAVEASTIANLLSSDGYPFKKIQESLVGLEQHKTQRAKTGGLARSEKYRALEKVAIEEYKKRHTEKSNNQAANDIWRSLSSDVKLDETGKPILMDHNAAQTIARWIAKYKRQNIKPVT